MERKEVATVNRKWYLVFTYFGGSGNYLDKEDKKIEILDVEKEEDAYYKAILIWKEAKESKKYDSKKETRIRPPFNPRLIFERGLL